MDSNNSLGQDRIEVYPSKSIELWKTTGICVSDVIAGSTAGGTKSNLISSYYGL